MRLQTLPVEVAIGRGNGQRQNLGIGHKPEPLEILTPRTEWWRTHPNTSITSCGAIAVQIGIGTEEWGVQARLRPRTEWKGIIALPRKDFGLRRQKDQEKQRR